MPAGCHGSSPCCRPVLAFAEGSAPGIEDARVAEMRPDLAELCVRTRRRRERPRARGRHGLAKGAGPGAKDGQGVGVGPLLPLPLPPWARPAWGFLGQVQDPCGEETTSACFMHISQCIDVTFGR